MYRETGETNPKPAKEQRRVLGKREKEMQGWHKAVISLANNMPIDFAQTPAGTGLMEALLAARDSVEESRGMIKRETAPVREKHQIK